VISPTPVSWTIRTISRIRSARAASTPPAASVSSPPERSRIARRSGSASSPKSASRSNSSSLEASPCTQPLEVDRLVGLVAVAGQLDRARERRVDRRGRSSETPLHEVAQLVDHRRVAVRRQDVQQRLRGDDLPDRRGERRRADFLADAIDLVEHLVEPVVGRLRAKLHVEGADEPDGELPLRRSDGDPRRDRRDRLVAAVLVDEVRGVPELVEVDAGREAEAVERLDGGLGGDAVHRQRDRVDGDGEDVRARARRLERGGERVPAGALRVQPDG
jgi:hypothetical protein